MNKMMYSFSLSRYFYPVIYSMIYNILKKNNKNSFDKISQSY